MTNQTTNYEPDNLVVLKGNTGAEAKECVSTKTGETFVALSLYTSNNYQQADGTWAEFPSTIHNVVAYDERLMKELLAFKSGARLRIEGKLTYREFEVMIDGKPVTKKEAIVRARNVRSAVLPTKKKTSSPVPSISEEMATT